MSDTTVVTNLGDARLHLSPRTNITKWLEKHKGGKWKYDGNGSWWCDDGERHVSRVALDCMDEDGPTRYYLYGGDQPGWLYF